jgi:hypothetical protein
VFLKQIFFSLSLTSEKDMCRLGRGRSRPYRSHKPRNTCRVYKSKNKMREKSTKMPYCIYILFLDRYLHTLNKLYGAMLRYSLRPHWKWFCPPLFLFEERKHQHITVIFKEYIPFAEYHWNITVYTELLYWLVVCA